jgi:hypothetical protein
VASKATDGTCSFTLSFPSRLDEKRVAAWLRSISGGLRGSGSLFGSPPTIGFELYADHQGLTYRLRLPRSHATYIVNQLRSLVPGMRVTPEDDVGPVAWTRAVEVGIGGSDLPLRIFSVADSAASLLASVQGLSRRDAVLIQWVMAPTAPQRPPSGQSSRRRDGDGRIFHLEGPDRDEIQERKKKLAEPNFMAVLRVAALAAEEDRAVALIARVRSSLLSASGPDTRFNRRFVSDRRLRQRIDAAAGAINYPIQLSVPEVAALIAWPVGEPFVAGLPQARSRHLPPTGAVARTGLVAADANMPGAKRPLAISVDDSNKHLHIVGPTGTGKTVLLRNLAAQAMESGSAVVVLEGKGDLFRAALDVVPDDRVDDVIVLDVRDTAYPVGFNILHEGSPRVVVEQIGALFEKLYRETRNVWTREMLYHGLSTLATTPGCTFIDLPPLLVPMTEDEAAWREEVVEALTDRELKTFWKRFLGQPSSAQMRMAQPVLDRVWQLNARPEIRNIIGQSESSFSMREVIEQRKVLLINLAGLGEATAGLAGTLLINALWSAVQASAGREQVHLLLDEFQDFLNLPVDPADMFAKARGYRLGIMAAHQNLGQLPPDLREAILANAHSKIVFQTAADDARTLAREFGRNVDDEDFMNLGRYEVLMKLAGIDGVSQPVSGAARPPRDSTGVSVTVRLHSRRKYGRPLADVEAEIDARRKPTASPKPKKGPKLGSTEWE